MMVEGETKYQEASIEFKLGDIMSAFKCSVRKGLGRIRE